MRYSEATIENGVIVEKNVREISQASLSSDCWLIQFKGLSACATCEIKHTAECGGGETLKRMKKNGVEVGSL